MKMVICGPEDFSPHTTGHLTAIPRGSSELPESVPLHLLSLEADLLQRMAVHHLSMKKSE
jgi:hypothetical protein